MDDSEIPDSELVCRAQVGDPTAQQLLIDRHKGLVFAVAKNNLGNRSDAEDVAQDTWTAFFMTSISRFDKNRPLRPFLLKICVHLASAYRRSRDRRSTVPIESYMVEDSSPPPGELLEQAERRCEQAEQRRALLQCIGELPPIYRQVIELHVFEGLSHREVAERLGITVVCARQRWHDAKEKLRTALARMGFKPRKTVGDDKLTEDSSDD